MRLFELKKTPFTSPQFIVFSLSHVNPLDFKSDIEKELRRVNFYGSIVFDLLLTVGNGTNRFMSFVFDGSHISLQSAEKVVDVEGSIKRLSCEFYREHYEGLDVAILSRPIKYRLRKGLAL